MTVSYEAPLSVAPVEALQPKEGDRYWHVSFFEQEAPDLAVEAQRIHAEGYRAMGFVTEDAIEEDKTLSADIDKARGPNVEYFLATKSEDATDADDRAALRKVHLTQGQTYEDLPAYSLSKDKLSDLGQAYLRAVSYSADLKEIGALARTKDAHPMAVHELFREIVQGAQGKNEVWMMTVVSTTYASLVGSFGSKNFILIGDNIPLDDSRVGDQIELKPAIVQPAEFIDNILASYNAAATLQEKLRLQRSFMFMTEGLPPHKMSEEVFHARQELLKERDAAQAKRNEK